VVVSRALQGGTGLRELDARGVAAGHQKAKYDAFGVGYRNSPSCS
jgi:hypothetical protein